MMGRVLQARLGLVEARAQALQDGVDQGEGRMPASSRSAPNGSSGLALTARRQRPVGFGVQSDGLVHVQANLSGGRSACPHEQAVVKS
jgi:hypothetical protein